MQILRQKRYLLLAGTTGTAFATFILFIYVAAESVASSPSVILETTTYILIGLTLLGVLLTLGGFMSEVSKRRSMKPLAPLLAGLAATAGIIGVPSLAWVIFHSANDNRASTVLSREEALTLVQGCKVESVATTQEDGRLYVRLFLRYPADKQPDVTDLYRDALGKDKEVIISEVADFKDLCGDVRIIDPV